MNIESVIKVFDSQTGGHFVKVVYYPEDDKRRHTDHYGPMNEKKCDRLADMIELGMKNSVG